MPPELSTTSRQRRRRRGVTATIDLTRLALLLSPLALLLALWIVAAFYFLALIADDGGGDGRNNLDYHGLRRRRQMVHGNDLADARVVEPTDERGRSRRRVQNEAAAWSSSRTTRTTATAATTIISRDPRVVITSSARGDLGPPSVLNQNPPGTDWIEDRWQAASDMGGTAIPGEHWVTLDFTGALELEGGGDGGAGAAVVFVNKVVLDWEAAYADDYRIEGRVDPPPPPPPAERGGDGGSARDRGWCTLYDGDLDEQAVVGAVGARDGGGGDDSSHDGGRRPPRRSVEEHGQSPGVKRKMPLHVVHTIDLSRPASDDAKGEDSEGSVTGGDCRRLRYLRVYVRKPARGWGVSLWEADAFGYVAR